jgi:hypothetical protein
MSDTHAEMSKSPEKDTKPLIEMLSKLEGACDTAPWPVLWKQHERIWDELKRAVEQPENCTEETRSLYENLPPHRFCTDTFNNSKETIMPLFEGITKGLNDIQKEAVWTIVQLNLLKAVQYSIRRLLEQGYAAKDKWSWEEFFVAFGFTMVHARRLM